MHRYRTHTCGALRDSDIGKDVRLSGWCHRIRDHGGVLFIDLRDHYGLTQVVADPDSPAFKDRRDAARRMGGADRRQGAHAVPPAPKIPTCRPARSRSIITEIEVLGPAGELPMPVFGDQEYPEETRLKYRFLDLRREQLHHNIMKRGAVIDSIRRRMKEQGFFEFQTPILTASSPEGARDYLVPSRIHPGKFYALPQAPQQFKQLIMIVGLRPLFPDRALLPRRGCARRPLARRVLPARSRDELRHPGGRVRRGRAGDARRVRGVRRRQAGDAEISADPVCRRRCANTAPTSRTCATRSRCRMSREAFRGSGFKIFAGMLAGDPKVEVWAIPAPKGGNRAFCDRMNSWAQGEGQPGLGYIFWREGEEGGAGPLAKNIGPERTKQIADQLGLGVGDAVFFVAGKPQQFVKFAGPARTKVGEELGLIAKDRFDFCWIVDFPMYEWNEEEKKIDFSHNPFSMPNMDRRRISRARSERQRQDARHQGDPVRHRLQRRGAVLRRDPQSPPGRDEEGLRHRRLSARTCWRQNSAACCARCRSARRRTAASRRASTASSCCSAARRTCARSCCSR